MPPSTHPTPLGHLFEFTDAPQHTITPNSQPRANTQARGPSGGSTTQVWWLWPLGWALCTAHSSCLTPMFHENNGSKKKKWAVHKGQPKDQSHDICVVCHHCPYGSPTETPTTPSCDKKGRVEKKSQKGGIGLLWCNTATKSVTTCFTPHVNPTRVFCHGQQPDHHAANTLLTPKPFTTHST